MSMNGDPHIQLHSQFQSVQITEVKSRVMLYMQINDRKPESYIHVFHTVNVPNWF